MKTKLQELQENVGDTFNPLVEAAVKGFGPFLDLVPEGEKEVALAREQRAILNGAAGQHGYNITKWDSKQILAFLQLLREWEHNARGLKRLIAEVSEAKLHDNIVEHIVRDHIKPEGNA